MKNPKILCQTPFKDIEIHIKVSLEKEEIGKKTDLTGVVRH
jgi:hypothetical protein